MSGARLRLRTLVDSSRGRWNEFLKTGFFTGHASAGQVNDMVQSFCRQIVRPAMLWSATAASGMEPKDDPGWRGSVDDKLLRPSELASTPSDAAWEVLAGGKSLPAIFKACDYWHRHHATITKALDRLDLGGWPVPFTRIEAEPGVALVSLSNSDELASESANLRHCVADYRETCRTLESVICSVRRTGPDGVERATSTIELSGWSPGRRWYPSLLQHRAMNNVDPTDEDVAAVRSALSKMPTVAPSLTGASAGLSPFERPRAAWRSLVSNARHSKYATITNGTWNDRVSTGAGYNWTDREAITAAFAAWSHLLPTPVRRAGPDGFLSMLPDDLVRSSGLRAMLHVLHGDSVVNHHGDFHTVVRHLVSRLHDFLRPVDDDYFAGRKRRLRGSIKWSLTGLLAECLVYFGWPASPPSVATRAPQPDLGLFIADRGEHALAVDLLALVAKSGTPCGAILASADFPDARCARLGDFVIAGDQRSSSVSVYAADRAGIPYRWEFGWESGKPLYYWSSFPSWRQTVTKLLDAKAADTPQQR
jgi:hypothetical protein